MNQGKGVTGFLIEERAYSLAGRPYRPTAVAGIPEGWCVACPPVPYVNFTLTSLLTPGSSMVTP